MTDDEALAEVEAQRAAIGQLCKAARRCVDLVFLRYPLMTLHAQLLSAIESMGDTLDSDDGFTIARQAWRQIEGIERSFRSGKVTVWQ